MNGKLLIHDIRYTMLPFGNPAYVCLSLDTQRIYYALHEARANVWLAEEE